MTDAEILALARPHEQYSGNKEVTLRGAGVVEFARELLAEQNKRHEAELLSVRAALAGQEYTPPGTHGAPAAPALAA